MDHYKLIQQVWDDLPDIKKKQMNRGSMYDRLKIRRIGDPSGNAVVYALNDGDWVVKVNKIDNPTQKLFSKNMDMISGVLRGDMDQINNNPAMARIAVYDTKIRRGGVAVTFEKRMSGQSLQSLFEKGSLPEPEKLCDMLNKVKRTLEFLFQKHRFNHNDLHYGNLFVTPEFEPVIFDFDWSTMDTAANYNDTKIFHGIIHAYRAIQRFGNTTKILKSNCTGTNLNAWYLIQNAYSIMMNKNGINTASYDPNIKKADMAMLLNNIILKLCSSNKIDTYRHLFAANLDNKLTLGSGEYFDCAAAKNDGKTTRGPMEWDNLNY